jgi:DNA-binding IclR family transcriptional regulator
MSIIRHIKRLRFLDFLIQKRATGDLENFAKKARLSKSGLSVVLQEMKEMGFPIKYDRQSNSYYYEEEVEMVQCLFIRKGDVLSREEAQSILADSNEITNLCFSKVRIFEVCDKS